MPPKTGRNRTRGPRLGDAERIKISVPSDLRAAAIVCAKAEGISEALWWRRAGHERALRQAIDDPALRRKLLGE